MPEPATLQEVMATLPDIEAAKAEAILATAASLAEIEEAQAWAAGESDVLGPRGKPLSSRVTAVFEILDIENPPDRD